MAHRVESMMSVGTVPWHGLGTTLPKGTVLTSEQAIRLAGLDWQVHLDMLFTADGTRADGAYATRRSSDGAVLGVVGGRYRPVQNEDAFKVFDHAATTGQIAYETAGSLRNGKTVWILARMGADMKVGDGDAVAKYGLFSNSHDGTSVVRMLCTAVRVVCANTLAAALGAVAEGYRIRHTASAEGRMAAAAEAMGIAQREYADFGTLADRLVRKPYTTAQMTRLAEVVMPAERGEVTEALGEKRQTLVGLLDGGRGHDSIRRTAWAGWNAVAEYADHHQRVRGGDRGRRLESIWFGGRAAMKAKALEYIAEQVGVDLK